MSARLPLLFNVYAIPVLIFSRPFSLPFSASDVFRTSSSDELLYTADSAVASTPDPRAAYLPGMHSRSNSVEARTDVLGECVLRSVNALFFYVYATVCNCVSCVV